MKAHEANTEYLNAKLTEYFSYVKMYYLMILYIYKIEMKFRF